MATPGVQSTVSASSAAEGTPVWAVTWTPLRVAVSCPAGVSAGTVTIRPSATRVPAW